MRQWSARAMPIAAAVAALLIGALMVALLNNARDSGVDALEDSLLAEVSAIARSQNQRVSSTLNGAAGLAQQPWELTLESEADHDRLTDLLQFFPELRTGFFLLDPTLTITQGVNLESRQIIGVTFDRAGVQELRDSESFQSGVGGYLPVSQGLTSSVPTIGLVFPILDATSRDLRGLFVFEAEVAADSNFNEEISQLSRGETGTYLFFDTRGTIIASSDPSLIARPVPDARLVDLPAGVHDLGDRIVVIQEVPAAGWRIAFQQDEGEFVEGLAGPLQSVGRILVVVTLLLGALLFVVMSKRLQAAREERDRLHRLAESQEEFISIVSHELRTPVAGVLGFLQTTLDHWETMSDDARRNAMRRSASNARRLQALTRDVLDTQAVESGRMAFSMATADLVEEIQVAVEGARSAFPDHEFSVDVDDGPLPLTADVDRLQQVLGNLLDNAARLSPPGAPIEVSARRIGDGVEFVVTDHGPGIPPDSIDRIFDKFVRGQASSVSGTGLGLYIARQIVEAHQGQIVADSAPGTGTRFTVTLPDRAAPPARDEAVRAPG